MKKMMLGCIIAIGSLQMSCEKDNILHGWQKDSPPGVSEKHFRSMDGANKGLVRPVRPIAIINQEMTTVCISSYQDLVNLLGANTVTVHAIVLQNGITIHPIAEDIGHITYTAIEEKTSSSIFSSYLAAKWRLSQSDAWQGFTSYVWTTGCAFPDTGQIFYTNLLKGNTKILINTSLTWNIGAYAGQNIQFLVIE